MRLPGLVGPSYAVASPNAECQHSVNLYLEIDELGTAPGGERGRLTTVPGLKPLDTIGTKPIRGLWTTANGVLWIASGNKLYKKASLSATPIEIGTLMSSSGPVNMDDNTTQLCIVDGPRGYMVNLVTDAGVIPPTVADTFTQIPPANVLTGKGFQGSKRVAFLDSYMIFVKPDSGELYWSALGDATDIDGLDFSTAEGSPDNAVGHIVFNREVWVGGTKTMEVFYDSGNGFARRDAAYQEIGLASAESLQKVANSLVWLGDGPNGKGIVWQSVGYQPQRISDHGLEYALSTYGDLSGATAWTHIHEGHPFYCLNIPGAPVTWCYDMSTKKWCERAEYSDGILSRHRVENSAFAFGKTIVGDAFTGKLYTLDPDWPYFGADPIHCERVPPRQVNGMRRTTYHSLQLDMETGNVDDPPFVFEFSVDDIVAPVYSYTERPLSGHVNANDASVTVSAYSSVYGNYLAGIIPGAQLVATVNQNGSWEVVNGQYLYAYVWTALPHGSDITLTLTATRGTLTKTIYKNVTLL